MSEAFVGEIRMFAGNFAPRSWALCNGQLLAISQNEALFSLYGTIYGGDGRSTFGLPDMRGRIPIHEGNGPGLTPRQLGQRSGLEKVTLNTTQLPSHTHAMQASKAAATEASPAGRVTASDSSVSVYRNRSNTTSFAATALQTSGGGRAHENMQPFLCVNFICALYGIYPSRS